MALNYPDPWVSSKNFWEMEKQVKDEVIQGRMVTAQHCMTDLQFSAALISPDAIKDILLQKLVESIRGAGFVEFTKTQDPITLEQLFRARIFVVPDQQVRILRLHGFDN
jgi:hypothetical protein